MKIISWNIKWIDRYEIKEREKRLNENKKRVRVAKDIIEKFNPDVLSLLEADISENIKIEGYNKEYIDRNYLYKYKGYKSGIVVYIKNDYKYSICEKVLNEIKENKVGCFLPIKIEKDNECFNCFFVWTTVKDGENGKYEPYGYRRFDEILNSYKFKETLEFIDGRKNDVIIIGDFNLVSDYKDDKDKVKIENWIKIKNSLENIELNWMQNNKKTFYDRINDYCFVSKSLSENSTFDVGNNSFGKISSDHNMIEIKVKHAPLDE